MSAVLLDWMTRVFGLGWLTGPIFDKEMRVSSRRLRNYVLRFLYIGLFTFLLALIWLEAMPYKSTSAYQSSRMAVAGQRVVSTVLWFEFITAQAIAIVMLSTSISDEISHRTLGVLMTTPVGSFQIVIGKLLSKLLQLVLLLAISLPLLAIVRVFGGVPWRFLVSGLCVTLTTALFVGSLSLFFSIFTRRAYSVILTTIVTMGLLFALIPLAAAFLIYYPKEPTRAFIQGLSYVNPYMILTEETISLHAARSLGMADWWAHCAVMVGASALLLLAAMMLVRKAALRQAMGQAGLWSGRAARRPEESTAEGRVRRVVGPPVFWKECRIPLFGKRKVASVIANLVAVGFLIATYVLCLREGILYDKETQVVYVIVFFSIGLLFTTVLPATCIAAEKESQTWPLLLTTAIGSWEIMGSKLGGVARRCLPAWALLFGHLLLFTITGTIHPIALFQVGVLVVWTLVFLSGTGMYFSLRFKHTTTAVIANMGIAATLWAIFPLLLGITVEVADLSHDLTEVYMDLNPFVHAIVIPLATAQKGTIGEYEWVTGEMDSLPEATGWILLTALIYLVVGSAFAAWAGSRMRRNPLS